MKLDVNKVAQADFVKIDHLMFRPVFTINETEECYCELDAVDQPETPVTA